VPSANHKKPRHRSNLERDFHRRFPALPYEAHRLAYQVTHHYTPDFQLAPNLFVETKGMFTATDRAKHLHIRRQHPDARVLLVFQNPRLRLSKASKTTYAQWCDAHNIAWLPIEKALTLTQTELTAWALNFYSEKLPQPTTKCK
jgi:hypothetical protein